MTFLTKTAVAASTLLAFGAPFAQASAMDSSSPTDEIVVTAKGDQHYDHLLHAAHVFTQADIDAAQADDLTDLLDQLDGISVRDSGGRGSQTGFFIRGVQASQTIVLIDGVRVGSATLGAAALNAYPIEAIERIEVLKGPFSGLYGADAVGGVIQIFTKKGQDGQSAISGTIGSNSLKELNAGLALKGERGSLHIGLQGEETDGIDRTSVLENGNGDLDAYEESSISLGGQIDFSDRTAAKLSILSTDNTVDYDTAYGVGSDLYSKNKTISYAANLSHQFTNNLRWVTTLGINEDETRSNGAFPSEYQTNRDTFGTELVTSFGDRTHLTTGVDFYQEDIQSSNDYPITNRDNKGIYAQLNTSFDALSVVTSLRLDDNSAYGDNTNGSLALGYQVNDSLRIVSSFGTAFVAPSFNYLYFPSFGNPALLPEESESAELSLMGESSRVNWRISAYQTEVKNLFSYDPETFLAANVGEAELKGVELAADIELADWRINLNADLLSAKNSITNQKLDDRAEKTLGLSVSRDFGKLETRFDTKLESGRYDNGGTRLPGYGLLDLSANYALNDQLSVAAKITNVLDKDYTVNLLGASDRYNTEGRQAKLTIRYTF